jgi:hypothetical protein
MIVGASALHASASAAGFEAFRPPGWIRFTPTIMFRGTNVTPR